MAKVYTCFEITTGRPHCIVFFADDSSDEEIAATIDQYETAGLRLISGDHNLDLVRLNVQTGQIEKAPESTVTLYEAGPPAPGATWNRQTWQWDVPPPPTIEDRKQLASLELRQELATIARKQLGIAEVKSEQDVLMLSRIVDVLHAANISLPTQLAKLRQARAALETAEASIASATSDVSISSIKAEAQAAMKAAGEK